MIKSGIYIIEDTLTGLKYVGQSKNVKNRLNQHKNQLKNNKHHNYIMQEDYNKKGHKFTFKVLEYTTDLDNRETYYIDKYDTVRHGFNQNRGKSKVKKSTEKINKSNSSSKNESKNNIQGTVNSLNKTVKRINAMQQNYSKTQEFKLKPPKRPKRPIKKYKINKEKVATLMEEHPKNIITEKKDRQPIYIKPKYKLTNSYRRNESKNIIQETSKHYNEGFKKLKTEKQVNNKFEVKQSNNMINNVEDQPSKRNHMGIINEIELMKMNWIKYNNKVGNTLNINKSKKKRILILIYALLIIIFIFILIVSLL